MKSAPFAYCAPSSLEEGLSLLADGEGEARILAGGQSLIPMLALRLARPSRLIDLRRVAGLAEIEVEPGWLRLGAMTTELTAERAPLVAAHAPLLREALGFVGHPAIRTRGTIGGSLCHADPAAELPAVAVVLNAELVACSLGRGQRTISAQDFFRGPFTTALDPDEVVTQIRIPAPAPGQGACFLEVSRRRGDFAMVGVAAAAVWDRDRLLDLRLALTGVGDRPRLFTREELALGTDLPFEEAFRAAGTRVAAQLRPPDDLHASAAYRRHLAEALVARALSLSRARSQPPDGHLDA